MKTFLEVFPDLHIAENVRGLLEMVGIEKISTNRDRSVIRVYIDSPRLMHKQSIYDLEKGIKEQLFPGKRVTIKILEKSVQPVHAGKTHECIPGQHFDGAEKLQYPSL
jgi:DNA polymerase-3 subunit alpha (Gram-positive type)